MPIVTAALSALEVLNELSSLIGSEDPLLIRFQNATEKNVFQFRYVREMNYITNRSLPSPYIQPGTNADATFGASSWTEASVLIDYEGKFEEKSIEIALKYNWISKHDATFQLKLSDGTEPVVHEGKIFESIRVPWHDFVIFVLSAGNVVEIAVEDASAVNF